MATPSPQHAIGLRQTTITDSDHDLSFPAVVLYPALVPRTPVTPLALGPFTVNATPGLAVAEDMFPVVVISHGRGGTNLGYFTIAEHLAINGYVVVLPLHHRDNYTDNSLSEADLTLELRSLHVSLTLDALAQDEALGPHLDSNLTAVIGHSMGAIRRSPLPVDILPLSSTHP
ncbi:MAG: hypothetical protein J6386_07935 [Candidatus Synoicihabitans palmerolidicus]|nr:hypothetical protein [Candidatus Synoicihabitans palmerolidicus]